MVKENAGTVQSQSAYRVLGLLRSMRPRQWLKNLLIFVPMAAGHQFSPDTFAYAMLAFAAFCMCASSAYLLNDVIDVAHDREHPKKRHRPIPAGLVSTTQALCWSALLGAGGLLIAGLHNFALLQTVAIYFTLTILYSLLLKKMLLLDVAVLSVLYAIRIVGGAAATGISLSFWLMSFSFFLFLSLALLKRHNELLRLDAMAEHSVPGRGYIPKDKMPVAIFGICSAMLSAIILLMYYHSGTTAVMYPTPLMLVGIVPFFFIWIAGLWVLSFRGAIEEDPLLHVSTDPLSILIVGICSGLTFLASQ